MMEHPLVEFTYMIWTAKYSLLRIAGYNAPFIAINSLAPGIDIVIKAVVGLVAVIGTLHTMYTNERRLKNELKNKKDKDV